MSKSPWKKQRNETRELIFVLLLLGLLFTL